MNFHFIYLFISASFVLFVMSSLELGSNSSNSQQLTDLNHTFFFICVLGFLFLKHDKLKTRTIITYSFKKIKEKL